ncbi:Hypothetical protein AA314_01553 [Archangium gephyra]|uniref:Uncharacterized protein n=1 Tax=Archangium gephyra TaxID=48 RepID=A0AAC8TBI3_9BACT|nr:Hypothetical protein AA314_01553 [Archangium gephyra]
MAEIEAHEFLKKEFLQSRRSNVAATPPVPLAREKEQEPRQPLKPAKILERPHERAVSTET